VKFLVDAQLPVRLTLFLNHAGHDAVHTSDLPNGNASTDAQVVEVANLQEPVDLRRVHRLYRIVEHQEPEGTLR
jgi:predicted nuclease of predicted toxin-antitoxin system